MNDESELLKTLHEKTGIEWEAVDCDPEVMGGSYQLMPYNACENGDFWSWHLTNSQQYFNSLEEAAGSLLRSWAAWQQRN